MYVAVSYPMFVRLATGNGTVVQNPQSHPTQQYPTPSRYGGQQYPTAVPQVSQYTSYTYCGYSYNNDKIISR